MIVGEIAELQICTKMTLFMNFEVGILYFFSNINITLYDTITDIISIICPEAALLAFPPMGLVIKKNTYRRPFKINDLPERLMIRIVTPSEY